MVESIPRRWPFAMAALALLLDPINGLGWITGNGHARDPLCILLAGVQTLTGGRGSVGLLLESLRTTALGRRAGLLVGVLVCSALAVGGLLAASLIYIGSTDSAGVGARFN